MNQANQVFIITFAIIAIGFLLKKFNLISENEGKTISKFLMNTTFPALMLVSTATVKLDHTLMLIPLFCIIYSGILLVFAWILFQKYPHNLKGILLIGSAGFNVGLFGFPIIEGLFGKVNLVYAVMFDIGNSLIVFGVLYPIGSYFSNASKELTAKYLAKRMLSLPPVIGLIVGLSINILEVPLPAIFLEILEILSKANKPLVLLLMGIYLSFDLDSSQVKAISKVLALRLVLAFVVVSMLILLYQDSSVQRNVLIICCLLPVGMSILPFSDELNYDSRIAGTLLNCSLITSFVCIWLVVLVLRANA